MAPVLSGRRTLAARKAAMGEYTGNVSAIALVRPLTPDLPLY
jgi:hypothetical protein